MKILTRDAVEFLLIDDDPAITKFLVTYLKQKGHTCEYLTEGFKTAAWLEFHRCDVVVVDLNMPKVSLIGLRPGQGRHLKSKNGKRKSKMPSPRPSSRGA